MDEDSLQRTILVALYIASQNQPDGHFDVTPLGDAEAICVAAEALRVNGFVEGSLASDHTQTAISITSDGVEHVEAHEWA